MKKVFILLLFFVEINFVFAQSNFAKLISMSPSSNYDVITKTNADNEILIFGLKFYSGFKYSYLLDTNGNIKWSHKYILPSTAIDLADLNSDLTFTDDKGFLFVGGMFGQTVKNGITLLRFDSLGNVLWAKRFSNYRKAYGVDIINKPNGRFAICAATTLPLNQGNKWAVNFLVIDSSGNVIKSKRIGNDSIDFIPNSMKAIGNGYVIEGECIYQWANYPHKPFLMKLDANGNVLKTKILDTYYDDYLGISGLTVTYDKKILHGFRRNITNNPYSLIKLDEDLNIIWSKSFLSSPIYQFEHITELPDSTYCLSGWGGSPHACKMDTAGNVITGIIINYPGNDIGRQMTSLGNKILLHAISWSPFIASDILITSDLNFNAPCYFLPVPFFSTSPFLVSDSLVTMNNISNYFPTSIDSFLVIDTILDYTETDLCSQLEINENILNKNISIFPNPTNDFITIHYNLSSPNQTTLSLFNLYGQKLKTILNEKQPAGEHEMKIDLKDVDAGIYFVKFISLPNGEGQGGAEEVRKVVKW